MIDLLLSLLLYIFLPNDAVSIKCFTAVVSDVVHVDKDGVVGVGITNPRVMLSNSALLLSRWWHSATSSTLVITPIVMRSEESRHYILKKNLDQNNVREIKKTPVLILQKLIISSHITVEFVRTIYSNFLPSGNIVLILKEITIYVI